MQLLFSRIWSALEGQISLAELVSYLGDFASSRAVVDPDALEDDLFKLHRDVDHITPRHTEIFLAVLYHLRYILSPVSVITTWFDLVLRPALRQPQLSAAALNEATELVVAALEIESEDDELQSKTAGLRRQIVNLYLLDAFNDGSGDDVILRAEMEESERQTKERWKTNLERVLITHGLHRPEALMTELATQFTTPSTRLQIFTLLNLYTSHQDFNKSASTLASRLASHPLTELLLLSLILDNSSTTCSTGLTLLVKLLPLFAVHASSNLKEILPQLLVILMRVVCWRDRTSAGVELDILRPPPTLEVKADIEWECLEATFDTGVPAIPSPRRFFTFLYYLFPCNVLRFLRTPHLYLEECTYQSPFTQDWDQVINANELKENVENLLRSHQCHPLIIWRDSEEELATRNFWFNYDVARISTEAMLLDSTNMALAIRAREAEALPQQDQPIPIIIPEPELPSEDTDSSTATSESHHRPSSTPRVSLQEMINTSVALKSNLNVIIEGSTGQWPAALFGAPHRDLGSRPPSVMTMASRPASALGSIRSIQTLDEMPHHVGQAIATLQREVVLLRNELNFELWLSRENIQHVGRLYKDRNLTTSVEGERQALFNKMRTYRAQVQKLEKELDDQREQASSAKNKYAEWNTELQSKLAKLRKDKEMWMKETAQLRSQANEAKILFEAQGKLLAEANQGLFVLQTTMKEYQPKVDRLRDYERQIERHLTVQKLWEDDWRKFREGEEDVQGMAAHIEQLNMRIMSYEQCQDDIHETISSYQRQIKQLEAQLQHADKPSRTEAESTMLSVAVAEKAALLKSNTSLTARCAALEEEVAGLKVAVEELQD
ncbi:hypothetical protein CYLTODRAFT_421458 [Cylindrobasidium torrendii FP15055 ss-10]|uniref:Hamartin-domain-containing protein n=1 Tax=Cylindrobasidium torrendii FP15055 ss-10 TaxID=1314674 RepID=A0A0D7BDJ1_9AGAR|nr:hypothetical protein CYLTODRAFT_421458 [Cylindrobasidium torrendii FP15055 ss-10]